MMLFKEFPYQKLPKFNRDCTNLVQIINVRIKFKVVVEYCLRNREEIPKTCTEGGATFPAISNSAELDLMTDFCWSWIKKL